MKDKIKEEEKLYCLEPDGDESFVEGVVGTFEKFFLLHRFLPVRLIDETNLKSQIKEGAFRAPE